MSEKYGRLTVLQKSPTLWACQCDCGTLCEKRPPLVTLFPETSSCGCLMREASGRIRQEAKDRAQQRHTEARNAKLERQAKREAQKARRRELNGTYASWYAMHNRCYDAYCKSYRWYGARGIQVCDRWHRRSKDGFNNFAADMGKRPQGYSIERVNCNGNYTPGNCKWIPRNDQPKNTRRTGRTKTRKLVLEIKSLVYT